MPPYELRWIRPQPAAPDIFELYQISNAFHQEVGYRQERDRYCAWYRSTAEQHQQEFSKLQRDIKRH